MYNVKQVDEPDKKPQICDGVLRALPNWFGIEASIVEYVSEVRSMPLWAAYDGDRPVGFAALKVHNAYTSEVYVMGVLEDYHRHGVGRELVRQCESFCRQKGTEYLTVKTLDASREDPGYAKTREFYLGVGFRPLEVFPTLWDKDNPCLFMAKYLSNDV